MTNGNGDDDAAEEAVDVAALRAELAEAQRIAKWLYDRSPGLSRFLGDTSEWPFLLGSGRGAAPPVPPQVDAVTDLPVLRAFAVLEAEGHDPFDAHHVAGTLGLSEQKYRDSLFRLVHAGYVTGGELPSGPFVETVTAAGFAAARL